MMRSGESSMAIEHRDELVARVDDADRALIRGDPEPLPQILVEIVDALSKDS